MRDAIDYEDDCSPSSVLSVNVMRMPSVPCDSVPLVRVSEVGFWIAAMTGVVRTISPLKSGHFMISPHVFHCKMFIYVPCYGLCGLCISSSWFGKCFLDLDMWGFSVFGNGGLEAVVVGFQGLGGGVESRG